MSARTRRALFIVGIGDFDHNGINDIMWRDTNTGHIDNWMLAYSLRVQRIQAAPSSFWINRRDGPRFTRNLYLRSWRRVEGRER